MVLNENGIQKEINKKKNINQVNRFMVDIWIMLFDYEFSRVFSSLKKL